MAIQTMMICGLVHTTHDSRLPPSLSSTPYIGEELAILASPERGFRWRRNCLYFVLGEMATGAWGTEAVERVPIKELPLINEVHIDGLVSDYLPRQRQSNEVLFLQQCPRGL